MCPSRLPPDGAAPAATGAAAGAGGLQQEGERRRGEGGSLKKCSHGRGCWLLGDNVRCASLAEGSRWILTIFAFLCYSFS